MLLGQLEVGKKAMVKKINLKGPTKERLHSFGLIKKVDISLVRASPLGSPKIYRLMNTLVAIRDEEASRIEVELKNEQ